jgi:hypothetical protein
MPRREHRVGDSSREVHGFDSKWSFLLGSDHSVWRIFFFLITHAGGIVSIGFCHIYTSVYLSIDILVPMAQSLDTNKRLGVSGCFARPTTSANWNVRRRSADTVPFRQPIQPGPAAGTGTR